MRYFFPASLGDETYENAEGTWFSTLSIEEAKAHAGIVAAKLALDDVWQGGWLHVVNEQGQEIARVQVMRPRRH
jgi:hypothetical protein